MGHIAADQANELISSCLQFPDIFKLRTAVLVRITFLQFWFIQIDTEQGINCLLPRHPAIRIDRMQVQLPALRIISDLVLRLP